MADSDLHSPLLNEEQQNGIRGDGGPGKAIDTPPITTFQQFSKESWIETMKLWAIAAPAIITTVLQYSIGFVTQIFAGHLGTLELASCTIANAVIGGLAYGMMMGMGSALETLCGQAFGAGQRHMLGVYMQRSWIILFVTALILLPVYIFATPILKLLGQTDDVSDLAGEFAIWILPQLFAYVFNFPMQKFLQSQSKVMAMAWISLGVLILHIFLSWLCVYALGLGLAGAAISLDVSWWLIVLGQLGYIVFFCRGVWTGLSWLALKDLWAFVRLSLASAVMLCLEYWYMMPLTLLTGHLKNAEISLDAISICLNLSCWEAMIFIGFNAAISVRVSNELGAGRPRAAKFAVIIVVVTALLIGIAAMVVILITKGRFAVIFTDSKAVMKAVSGMTLLLSVTMVLNSVQPVLSGVAVGGGWQALIAYINIGCYYGFGVPLGLLLGYKLDLGIKGIWSGMVGGPTLQTIILLGITYFTNWNREAAEAKERLRFWGGADEVLKDGAVNGNENGERKDQPLDV
eukprot:Gb_24164 [translate_table: standard]